MATLVVLEARSQLSLKSERIMVTSPEEDAPEGGVSLHEISQVTIGSRVSMTSAVMHALLKRQVPILYLDWNGAFLGSVQPPTPPRALTRLSQYALGQSEKGALPFARSVILSKLHNEHRILQRLYQRHQEDGVDTLKRMKSHVVQAQAAETIESLRGVEGNNARVFFSAWASYLPEEFPFEKRTTRPPGNPVNAVLSYLSAIVYGEMLSATYCVGLDPAIGVFHAPTQDRFSLPLDLMEPFRPAVIYPLTLRFFTQKILSSESFQKQDGNGVWLGTEGKRTLHQHYEKMMLREFYSEHLEHRTSLREQLKKTPTLYKMALENSQAFLPFQLNGTAKRTSA